MICGNALYSTLYREAANHTAGKKVEKDQAVFGAEFFLEKEEEIGKKRGKQSVLDDAKAAGKEPGAQKPKTETESRIVVKPDGTRVLVITVRCGQSVRVKSLKLSDPTDMENEGKQKSVSGQPEEAKEKAGQEAVVDESSVENLGNTVNGAVFALAGEPA